MGVVAHFGTFDVENFGDLLFPAILERRLRDLGHTVVHVSPLGGLPVWDDCVSTVGFDTFTDALPPDLSGVVVGGGHIIHASPTTLPRYDQGGLSAILAYPQLWLGAALIAAQRNVPYCWNAPGVAQSFSPAGSRLAEWATSIADYLAVRDHTSRARLREAGVMRPVRVVPDTALEAAHLWTQEELDEAYRDAFAARGRSAPDRVIVIHLNQRYVDESNADLAARLDRIALRFESTPILIAMGPCHGDDALQREVGGLMASAPLVIDHPRSLREIVACLARAQAYLGSSLHGMIVSCAFGTPGMVIVPPSAGAVGKFLGFLEPLQLAHWIAATWETTEQRMDEFVAAPREPWSRVLTAALPALDDHWRWMKQCLEHQHDETQSAYVPLDKHEALQRFTQVKGATELLSLPYLPLIAEQAIRSGQLQRTANAERRAKETAQREQHRAQQDLENLQASLEAAGQSAEDVRRQYETLQSDFAQSEARFRTEIAAAHEALEAGRREKEQALAERDHLRASLDNEHGLKQELLARFEALQMSRAAELDEHAKLATKLATEKDGLANELHALRAEFQRSNEEVAERVRSLEIDLHLAREESELERTARAETLAELERMRAQHEAERTVLELAHGELVKTLQETQTERDTLRVMLDVMHMRHDEDLAGEQAATAAERAARDAAVDALEQMRMNLSDAQLQLETALQARETLQRERDHEIAEAMRERDRLNAALLDARGEFTEMLAAEKRAAATERGQKEFALARQEHLERQHTEGQATLEGLLRRADEQDAVLRVVARQAALIDVVLDRARGLVAGKGKRGKSLDDVVIAQEQLARLRGNLAALERPQKQHGSARAGGATYDPHRTLPGHPEMDATTNAGTSSAGHNGHLHQRVTPASLVSNGWADAGHAAVPGPPVDIIICVHNAIDDVQRCLDSVVRQTSTPHRLIIVDDGSDEATAQFLQDVVQELEHATLLRNDLAVGYTKAANQGLHAATGEVMVLLNSDTIVTPMWLDHLLACLQSDPQTIGIAGPLSNAATYQSVPERFDANGDWSQNPLPPGWSIDAIATAVARISQRVFPRVPFVNGFCFAITRAVFEAIGGFDEAGFPDGYGEENDFCLRAADAGFVLAIADQAYVHHAKSRSYTHERRRVLGKRGRTTLIEKYSLERLEAGEAQLRANPDLATLRSSLAAFLQTAQPTHENPGLSVLFLLPVGGGGGGAHSIVQEASGMRRLGIDAQVAIRAQHLERYQENYPTLGENAQLFYPFHALEELQAHAARFSVVVGTIHTSIPLLAEIAANHPNVLPAYYIQDYEPFFYPEGTAGREVAAQSYTLVPNAILFAKTDWLCETVGTLHDVTVHKVSPSLDHAVYYPPASPRRSAPVRVVAMIRPSSARRGAGRTMDVLQRLAADLGEQVAIHIFGCRDGDLVSASLPVNFPFTNHGVLTREEVAARLRESDVFLDLSDYQAFGRTGLEAMACGCAVVLPSLGGTSEYAIHGENALLVDTSNGDICYQAAHALITHHDARQRLQSAGIAKAAEYSIDRAAISELEVFAQKLHVSPQQPTVTSLHGLGMAGSIL